MHSFRRWLLFLIDEDDENDIFFCLNGDKREVALAPPGCGERKTNGHQVHFYDRG